MRRDNITADEAATVIRCRSCVSCCSQGITNTIQLPGVSLNFLLVPICSATLIYSKLLLSNKHTTLDTSRLLYI